MLKRLYPAAGAKAGNVPVRVSVDSRAETMVHTRSDCHRKGVRHTLLLYHLTTLYKRQDMKRAVNILGQAPGHLDSVHWTPGHLGTWTPWHHIWPLRHTADHVPPYHDTDCTMYIHTCLSLLYVPLTSFLMSLSIDVMRPH